MNKYVDLCDISLEIKDTCVILIYILNYRVNVFVYNN